MTTRQGEFVTFTWLEVFEVKCTLQIWCKEPVIWAQLEALLDKVEDSHVFRIVLGEVDLPPNQREDGVDGELQVTKTTLVILSNGIDQRLGEDPYRDAECSDNDSIDVLHTLRQKLQNLYGDDTEEVTIS